MLEIIQLSLLVSWFTSSTHKSSAHDHPVRLSAWALKAHSIWSLMEVRAASHLQSLHPRSPSSSSLSILLPWSESYSIRGSLPLSILTEKPSQPPLTIKIRRKRNWCLIWQVSMTRSFWLRCLPLFKSLSPSCKTYKKVSRSMIRTTCARSSRTGTIPSVRSWLISGK